MEASDSESSWLCTRFVCCISVEIIIIYTFCLLAGFDFPPYLEECDQNLTVQTFERIFDEVLIGNEPTWHIRGIPEKKFYVHLHHFLKKWPVSRRTTKQAIGRFYLAIDPNFSQMRADNAYRKIEQLQDSTEIMSYGNKREELDSAQLRASSQQMEAMTLEHGTEYGNECVEMNSAQLRASSQEMEGLTLKYAQLRVKFEKSQKELRCARKALQEITSEKERLQNKCRVAKAKLKEETQNYAVLENMLTELHDENLDLASIIADLQELELENTSQECTTGNFSLQTKNGRKYSTSVRRLYYKLLSQQIPASNIAEIIKTVIRCLFPAIDTDSLILPKRSCADYMRKCELATVSSAHKATVFSECKSGKLQTDGTTKHQKKIGGIGINGMVVSVNELPDGSAESIIEDVSKELEKLRKTAHALNLPGADRINWTLFTSSTSDSAATQKRFNKLIESCRDDDARFGTAIPETLEIVESFCSMHLGVNLRQAFLSGMLSSAERHHPVEKFIYEVCKLLGRSGTPEYGCGVQFRDFIKLMIENADSMDEDSHEYYQVCAVVKLHRQVGSRYFVSANNAAKIYFLADSALAFLRYTGKDHGNKLEIEVFAKLENAQEMAQLRVDALLYYHVYADLMMLSKSKTLGKCVMDMNVHYF